MPSTTDQEYAYKVGNITFIVTPVYKPGQGETIAEILLKLMKADVLREAVSR